MINDGLTPIEEILTRISDSLMRIEKLLTPDAKIVETEIPDPDKKIPEFTFPGTASVPCYLCGSKEIRFSSKTGKTKCYGCEEL